jgi:HPt (histidine-containing phosphotransfer) domain-containing protein
MASVNEQKIKQLLEENHINPDSTNIKKVKELMASDSTLSYEGAVALLVQHQPKSEAENIENKASNGFNLLQQEDLAIAVNLADVRVDNVIALSNQLFPVRLSERLEQGGSGLIDFMAQKVAKQRLNVLDNINYDRWRLNQSTQKQLAGGNNANCS